jgi:hypothetical protein
VIQHDSSGQGKVAQNDLYWMLHGGHHGPRRGRFYRTT